MSFRRAFGDPDRRSFLAQLPEVLKSAISAPPRRRRRATVPTTIETMELRLYLSGTPALEPPEPRAPEPAFPPQDERQAVAAAVESQVSQELRRAPDVPRPLHGPPEAVPPEIADPEPERAQECTDVSGPFPASDSLPASIPLETRHLAFEMVPARGDASRETVESTLPHDDGGTLQSEDDDNASGDTDDEMGGWIDISAEATPTGPSGIDVLVDPQPASGPGFGFVDALATPETTRQGASPPGLAAESGGFIELQFSEVSPTWQRQVSSRDSFRQGRASEVDASIGRLVVFESADATGSRLGQRSSLSGVQSRLRSSVARADGGGSSLGPDTAEDDDPGLFGCLLASQKLNSLSSFISRILGAR